MTRAIRGALAVCVGLVVLTACGDATSQLATPTSSQEATPAAKRLVLPDYQFGAPLKEYLGSKSRFSVIRAKVSSKDNAEYGPTGPDDASRPPIFTPYRLQDVEVLRGPSGPISRMLLEGGTVGADTVEVENGAIEPEIGTVIYAVVLAPGLDGQQDGTVRAYHVFPITDSGRVFLPEWVAFDSQHPNDGSERYSASGKETRGRTIDGPSADRAMRQP